jgi:hypothetical protein
MGTFGGLGSAGQEQKAGLTISIYAAEPGSRSEEALMLLGSWAATIDPAEPTRVAAQS